MMTFEDVRKAALTKLMEFGDRWPQGRAVPYRRIGVRQQQLYAHAARVNPEYAGVCAIGTVVDGAVDFAQMEPPIKRPEAVTLVEVHDPGSSYYEVGERVTIVTADDPDGVEPRARLRNRVLEAVGSDLDGVGQVKVWYPFVPQSTDPEEDGTREVEVSPPHSELLVVDLARDYARKAISIEPDVRTAIVKAFDEEEVPLLEEWVFHVAGFAPLEARLSGA